MKQKSKQTAILLLLMGILSACTDRIYLNIAISAPKEIIITEKSLDWGCLIFILILLLISLYYILKSYILRQKKKG
jgi:hypothetical protein